MSLTEILLSLAIMIAVIAGIAVNYSSVKARADEQKVMQGIEMLRANIEQIYGNSSFEELDNTLLVNAKAVPASLLQGETIRTPWGGVTVTDVEGVQYSISLEGLPIAACRNLATLSTSSWSSVSIGENEIFNRVDATDVKPSSILAACSESTNTLTFVGP